jgi:molecular chaperone Hsp33
MSDRLLPFLFESADVRGAVVNLDATWREVLVRREYPLAVRSLLGEAMAAAALLSSTLKFDGALVLQTQAAEPEAPVRLMVVECNADLTMRATARLGSQVPAASRASLDALVGDGKLVVTLDPRDGEAAYQGVVPLSGERLAAALEDYMQRSEQLDTRIVLAADDARAAGLLVQRMPGEGGRPADASRWDDAVALASTLSSAELLTLDPRAVVHRLFHEIDVRVFDERPTRFRCTCSRERVAGMLRMLGQGEVESIVAEQGRVSVDCDFCHQGYVFDAIDAAQVFVAGGGPTGESRH